MQIQLASDLHLERDPDWRLPAVPGADTLVLAGDIGSYQAGSRLTDDDFGLSRFSPLQPGCPWQRVLYVPGNHEYDGADFEAQHLRLRGLCERLGITWLERQVLQIDGVRFIGTTLWTDFDALAAGEQGLTRQLAAREKAYRAANYTFRRFTATRDGVPLLAEQWREQALICQDWLRRALATPFRDGPTVVVTHHAPSLLSADPRYGVNAGTAGFCNRLDELFDHADIWLHGHLHCALDYRAGRADRCRVVANPLGYAGKGEREGFRPALLIDPRAAAARAA